MGFCSLKIKLAIIIVCAFILELGAQGSTFALELNGGRIWKHKEDLYYDTPAVSGGFQLTYQRKLKTEQDYWRRVWGDPSVGFAALYMSFGDKEVLGHAIGVLTYASFDIFRTNTSRVQITNGFGIARLNRLFNEVNNTDNNAIGSRLNNVTKFGLRYNRKFSKFNLIIGTDFTHFSNGGSQSPNSGINVITGVIGLEKPLNGLKPGQKEPNLLHEQMDTIAQRRFGFNFNYHVGFFEDDVPNGPKYLIQAISSSIYRQFSPRYRLHVGLEFEHNESNYFFARNTFQDEATSRRLSRQFIFIVANEFFLVNYSFRFQTGFYTNYPSNFENGPFYFKFISQYHFDIPNTHFRPSIGVMMKSHWAKAENIALVLGFDF